MNFTERRAAELALQVKKHWLEKPHSVSLRPQTMQVILEFICLGGRWRQTLASKPNILSMPETARATLPQTQSGGKYCQNCPLNSIMLSMISPPPSHTHTLYISIYSHTVIFF